jgi:hypothetical protein
MKNIMKNQNQNQELLQRLFEQVDNFFEGGLELPMSVIEDELSRVSRDIVRYDIAKEKGEEMDIMPNLPYLADMTYYCGTMSLSLAKIYEAYCFIKRM